VTLTQVVEKGEPVLNPPAAPSLVRAMGRWALTAAIINSVIGSGVFGLPSSLAGFAGAWSPVTVLIAGAGIFVIVLCLAEVGSRFTEAGGPYLYTREAFGPALAFQVGWLHIWTRVLSGAAVLNVLSSYLSTLVPWTGTPVGRAVSMIVAVALVTIVNIRGVRQASWTINAFTIAKLLPLILVAVVGCLRFNSAVAATQVVAEPRWTEAVLLLMFGYGGFESGVVAGSEVREPKRDTAFALITAMVIIAIIYLMVQVAVVGGLPNAAASKAPVAETLGLLFGHAGLVLGSVAVVISVYGWLTGASLMGSRIFYALAGQGDFPAILGKVNPVTRTPIVAIVIHSMLILALGLGGGFVQIATFGAVARMGIYAVTCAALIGLRRKCGMPEGFSVPAGTLVALIGVGFSLWLLSTRDLSQAWVLPLIVAMGVAVWLVMHRGRTRVA
jgi:amino acid transporter